MRLAPCSCLLFTSTQAPLDGSEILTERLGADGPELKELTEGGFKTVGFEIEVEGGVDEDSVVFFSG